MVEPTVRISVASTTGRSACPEHTCPLVLVVSQGCFFILILSTSSLQSVLLAYLEHDLPPMPI